MSLTDRSWTHTQGSVTLASTRPRDARRRNVAAVLRAIFANGPMPRADLARSTGLSSGAVTKIAATLVAGGLLREQAPRGDTGSGRPATPLELDLDGRAVVGLHIGLLRTTVGLVDLRGTVLGQAAYQHAELDPHSVVLQAREAVDAVVGSYGAGRRILGVGASIGGWVEPRQGLVMEHPSLGWHRVELREQLATALERPVHVDNSVQAAALAELWFGAATTAGSLVELFVGNIVGAAVVVDRRIHRGPKSASGHLAHFPLQVARGRQCSCGRRNCFQALASDLGVVTAAREQGLVGAQDTLEQVVRAARAGDRQADQLLRARARMVGQVVAVVLELIDPELVVLAGGVLDAREYLPDIRAEAARRIPVEADVAKVVPTGLGEVSLVLASAAPFLDTYYADPLALDTLTPLEAET